MRSCVLSACALLLFAAPVVGADDPLDAFPAQTSVVLRIGAPAVTSGKVKGFLNNAAPRYAQLSDSLGPALGSLIGNPTLAGVNPKGDWYVAVLPRAEKSPSLMFAVPATKAEDLKKAVGQGYAFAEFEQWVVYSLDADAVAKVSSADRAGSVRSILTDRLQKVFGQGEVAMVLNAAAIRKTYQAQIGRAKEQLLRAAGTTPPGVEPSPALKVGQEYNRKLAESLIDVIDDVEAVAKSVSLTDDALSVEAIVTVKAGSDSARFLAAQSPSELPLVEKLPEGRLAYYAVAGDFSRLISASAQLTLASYPQNAELQALGKEFENVHFREIAGMFELGNLEDGVIQGVSLTRVDSPKDYLSLARRMVEAMGSVKTGGLQQEMSVKRDAETIEGSKVDVVHVKLTPAEDGPAAASTKDMMQIMFGKDGMTQRIAVIDDLFIQAIGGSNEMANAIKSVRNRHDNADAAAKAADKTREALDAKANLLTLVDLPRLAGGALQLAIESKRLPLPLEATAIEDLNLAPSYAGLTVVAEQDAATFSTLIPAEQVRGFVELVNVLQKAAPQRGRAN